jgi:adenosylcobinamide kinase / adenosylcobinamide-phosphate guanylyltransferase
MAPIILVTGPARSGKSAWAEALAAQGKQPVTYVATARLDPADAEWRDRIAAHIQRRPPHWRTVEIPLELAPALALAQGCWLIDSLGTWLANQLDHSEAQWQIQCQSLLSSLESTAARVIFVAEETGWGIVPAYPLGRQFRDRLGDLTHRLASLADETYLVTAGHALPLHRLGHPLNP